MTYKEFYEKIADIGNVSAYVSNLYKYGSDLTPRDPYGYSYYKNKNKADEVECLYVEWYTGGYSGGNCWNDTTPTYSSSSCKPEELKVLDEILAYFCPKITFLEYKTLTNTLLHSGSYSISEYYGNSSDYSYYYVVIKDLYDYMSKAGWLDEKNDQK